MLNRLLCFDNHVVISDEHGASTESDCDKCFGCTYVFVVFHFFPDCGVAFQPVNMRKATKLEQLHGKKPAPPQTAKLVPNIA